MNKTKKFDKTRLIPFIVAAIVGLGYFVFNFANYTAPLSLYDEIGYLSKAATLAGSPVDMASSWFGGYSLLISPAFWFFTEPNQVWTAVLVMNSLMWAASAALVWYMLRALFPKKTSWAISIATLFTFLFPSFIGMSGHAFSTTGFVFVLACAFAALVKSRLTSKPFLLLFAVLMGLTAWIHPTGVVVVAATVLFFVLKSLQARSIKKYAFIIVLPAAVGMAYTLFVHPWLNAIMTPEGFAASSHYGTPTRLLNHFSDPTYWKNVSTLFLGQLSYVLVSTLGVVVFGLQRLFEVRGHKLKSFIANLTKDTEAAVVTISALALLGFLVMGALSFAPMSQGYTRADIWIYGRYAEVAILPLLAVGILSKWRAKLALFSAGVVALAALVFSVVVNEENTKIAAFHISNILGFWPQQFTDDVSYVHWFVVGALAIAVTGFLGQWNKKWLVGSLVLPLFIGQVGVHQAYWKAHTQDTSGLVNFVRLNYEPGTCIGFVDNEEVTVAQRLRYRLYSFYFHDYDFRRVNAESWAQDCGGVYLAYDDELIRNTPGAQLVAREQKYGMLVAIAEGRTPDMLADADYRDFYVNYRDPTCVVSGCFDWRPSYDATKTRVGKRVGDALNTTGRTGSLVYGPYLSIDKGDYTLTINGDFRHIDEQTRLEVAAGSGDERAVYIDEPLTSDAKQTYMFTIPEDAKKFEVKIFVGKEADISLESYSVDRN